MIIKDMRAPAPGFTLIELVVVIVVLAILAAVALPRFMDLTTEARIAKLEGARGAVAAAAGLANAKHIVQYSDPVDADSPVSMTGLNITMLNRYPTANATGIVSAAQLSSTDFTIVVGPSGPVPAGSVGIRVPGGANPVTCSFVYTPPAVLGGEPVISFVSTTGCQ
jgi:MSHA pilin protein MshA